MLTYGIGFLLEDDTALMSRALLGAGVGAALVADANSMVSSALEDNHALELARLLARRR